MWCLLLDWRKKYEYYLLERDSWRCKIVNSFKHYRLASEERAHGTHDIGSCVVLKVNVDSLIEKKPLAPIGESNTTPSPPIPTEPSVS
jgi:hypothetical protein